MILHVKSHRVFDRDGDDLICELPITFVQAALGSEVDVPTLTGKASIRIPAGTQNGTIFRLRGKGVKSLLASGHGDLHVRVNVEVPSKLSSDQKKKLEEFSEACDSSVYPKIKDFIDRAKRFFS